MAPAASNASVVDALHYDDTTNATLAVVWDRSGRGGLGTLRLIVPKPTPRGVPMRSSLAAALVAASPDAILIADEAGHFVGTNPAALALLGYSREALLRLSVADIMAPGPVWAAAEYARFRREGVWQGEVEVRTNAGGLVPAEARAIVVPGPDGNHYASFLRDMTDRKHAEGCLQRSEERFRTAFEEAAIGMSLVDLDGHFLRVNASLCTLTGYSEGELRATTFQAITHPDDQEMDRVELDLLLAGQILAYQREKRYLRQDGTVVWVRVNSALVHDERGEPLHLIGQVEDITARKLAEDERQAALEAAQAANRAKGVFLDMMSHELRTPLQAVLGYSEFLLLAPAGSLTDEQRLDISYIHQAGGRMIVLVNQLLDLSRLEAGGIVLATDPVDLAQVIEAVRQDIAPQAAAKGLVVQIDLAKSLPSMTGDAVRLRQVLLNLASNAVKFTQVGHIQITAAATASRGVVVEVSDTGIGITADALVHIFEAFHQVDSSLTRSHEGSGLGLAIAWKLVQQMGGSLSVSSESGTGSTFRVHLPTNAA